MHSQLTPIGLTVFRGIHAIDRDKPNTANSDITYSIVVSNTTNFLISIAVFALALLPLTPSSPVCTSYVCAFREVGRKETSMQTQK